MSINPPRLQRRRHILKAAKLLLDHPRIKKIAARHPRAYGFLLDRFSFTTFNGLPLTVLALAFIGNLFLLSKIVEKFVNSEWLLALDNNIAHFFYRSRTPITVNTIYHFTYFGSEYFGPIIGITALIYFWARKKPRYLAGLAFAMIGTVLTIRLSKRHFHRLRPEEFSYYPEWGFSFPSGHATFAVAFYGVMFYYLFRHAGSPRTRMAWAITGVLFILMLGFSRIYLAVHFFSDVIAGFSAGFLWFLLAVTFIESDLFSRERRRRRKEKASTPSETKSPPTPRIPPP